MKSKFLFSLLFAALALFFALPSASAQTTASKVIPWVQSGDTLGTSTTLTYELAIAGTVDKTKPWEYSILVEADSISGANAGTVTLQVSNDPAGTASPLWFDYDTDTIDGATTQVFNYEGKLYHRRLRVLITSPSGTRRTDVKLRGLFRQVQ
jgi:hypothetical protein